MSCMGSIATGVLLGMGLLCVLNCLKGAFGKGRGRAKRCCQEQCYGVNAACCDKMACCHKIACSTARKMCCDQMSCCTKQCCAKKSCCPMRVCGPMKACGPKTSCCQMKACCPKTSCCQMKACCPKKPGCTKGGCKKPCCYKKCGSGGWRHPPGSFGHNSRYGIGGQGGFGRSGGRGCSKTNCGRPYASPVCGSGRRKPSPGSFGHNKCDSRRCGSGLFGGSHRHYRLLSSEDETWIDGGGDCERIIALHDLNS